MNKFLQKTFLQKTRPRSAAFRYGFLAVILALFAFVLYHPMPRYLDRLVVPVMLLLNHLAFQFCWPGGLALVLRVIALVLRVIALAWVVGGCIYIFAR